MSEQRPAPAASAEPTPPDDSAQEPGQTGISLDQLSEAFAEMMQPGRGPAEAAGKSPAPSWEDGHPPDDQAAPDLNEINPRNLLEAMLFVGDPTGQPLAKVQVTSILRGVGSSEIDQLVAQLNEVYARDGSPYQIVSRGADYQLVLRDEFAPIRDRCCGRTRRARLSQAAIETLAVVAYRQPVTADQVSTLRGAPSGRVLSQLVRRQLVRLERPDTKPRTPVYRTADRFLELFGLDSLADLPQSEQLEAR